MKLPDNFMTRWIRPHKKREKKIHQTAEEICLEELNKGPLML